MVNIRYLLSLNRYSRNGRKTNNPKGIVLHHAENEGYGAIETRNYFDNLKHGKNAIYYSTHYIVGFNGEIINCVPEDEVAYHRGYGEESSGYISITCCSRNKASAPEINSLLSLKSLVREIAKRYDFDVKTDFFRHYDISGIKCPLFYVEKPDKWYDLKSEIISDAVLSDYLIDNSEEIAVKLSSLTGIDKKHLTNIFNEKTAIDMQTMSKIIDCLLINAKL